MDRHCRHLPLRLRSRKSVRPKMLGTHAGAPSPPQLEKGGAGLLSAALGEGDVTPTKDPVLGAEQSLAVAYQVQCRRHLRSSGVSLDSTLVARPGGVKPST